MLALLQAPQALSDTLARGKALAAEKGAQSEGVTWVPVKVSMNLLGSVAYVCFEVGDLGAGQGEVWGWLGVQSNVLFQLVFNSKVLVSKGGVTWVPLEARCEAT